MPPTKRAGDDVEGGSKKKGGGAGRTGQACDRCKIRKIRCDARAGGCSPCLQNNTECKTTDRITGRANSRGHTETLENENTSLKMYMVELQQQLRDNGLEPKAPTGVPPGYIPAEGYWHSKDPQQGSWGDLNTDNGLSSSTAQLQRDDSQASLLPDFKPGCIGDNYLGVSSANNWLSPIEGTSLSLFGMKLDVAEFLPPESDPTVAPMLYQNFLMYAMGKTRLSHIPSLPSQNECKVYSEWYFRCVQVFAPVLHRPDFMNLLTRIFHEQYQPNTAETAMLHTVIAIMKFQYYCRNGADQLRGESMKHYHYALSLIPDLMTGHTLQDIQALVLICTQLRSQPRPGAAWMFTNLVFGLAVETGLHRSARNWQNPAAEGDAHTIEMRKRIFWSILLLHVNLSSKLGRPMPIRLEDFDIEIPDASPDHLPEERNFSNWRKCSFQAALQGWKLLRILMQVYSTVYSIRSGSAPYDTLVQNIDKQLRKFREQLPAELSGGPSTMREDRCPALYLQLSEQTLRLVLHHPSLCRSTSPQLMADNLDKCLDASSKLLSICTQLKSIKSLDTTWMTITDYLAAIFTTLFVHTQRQDDMGSSDLQRLRQDMDAWLEVIGDAGKLLGARLRLREAVRPIIDFSISSINRHLAAKTASAGLASADSPSSSVEQLQPQASFPATNGYPNGYNDDKSANSRRSFSATDRRSEEQRAYQQGAHFYPDPQNAAIPQYTSESLTAFSVPNFNSEDIKLELRTQRQRRNSSMAPQTSQGNQNIPQITPHPVPTSFLPNFHEPANQNTFHEAGSPIDMAGPAAWRDFADNMMTNLGGTDHQNSASALMTLGNDKSNSINMSGADVASIGGLQIPHDGQHSWPLL